MKHIVFKSFGIIIMASALALACTKSSQSEYGDGDKTFLPIGNTEVHATGETLTFSYTADYDWRVFVDYDKNEEEQNWITAISMGSDVQVTVSAFSKNNKAAEDQRSATIVLTSSSGKRLDSFKITQKRLIFDFDASGKQDTYPAWVDENECMPMKLIITKGAVPRSSLDWVDLKPSASYSAKDTDEYLIRPKHNPGFYERNGELKIICDATNDVSDAIQIGQLGFEFKTSDMSTDAFNEIPKDSDKRKLTVTCSGEWTVNAPSWIKFTDAKGASIPSYVKGTADVYVNALVNASTAPKEDKIEIKVKDVEVEPIQLQVSQKAYTWKVEGKSGLIYNVGPIPGSDENKSFNVTSSGLWKTSFNSSELEVEPSQAVSVTTSPQKVTVTVKPNYTKSPRTIKLTFVSDDYDKTITDGTIDLVDTVKFEQSAYLFTISDADLKTPLGAAVKSTRTIPVTCSGKLQSASVEESAKEWLEAKIDGQNVILTAMQANTTGQDRTASVTIASEHTTYNSDLKYVLPVTQSK